MSFEKKKRYGRSKADQLQALMDLSDSPYSVGFLLYGGHVYVAQNDQKNWLAFPSHTMLREIGEMMIKAADMWERGEFGEKQKPAS